MNTTAYVDINGEVAMLPGLPTFNEQLPERLVGWLRYLLGLPDLESAQVTPIETTEMEYDVFRRVLRVQFVAALRTDVLDPYRPLIDPVTVEVVEDYRR